MKTYEKIYDIGGVRVLAEEEIKGTPQWLKIVNTIIPAIIGIMLYINQSVTTIPVVLWLLVAFAFGFFAIVLCLGTFDVGDGRMRYKCLFEDNVFFCDIMDYFDIVDRDGEIWVIEDKDE